MRSDAFRAAAEAKDFSAIEELFAPDVVFRSPVVYKPYEGLEALKLLLGAVVQVFEDFRYLEQVEIRGYRGAGVRGAGRRSPAARRRHAQVRRAETGSPR